MESLLRLSLFLFLLTPPVTAVNPFSPKASLLRHWTRHFHSKQIPSVLFSKSSPLNSSQLATFSQYINTHSLPSHIRSFCTSANLFCMLKSSSNVISDVSGNADFNTYADKDFKRYQKSTFQGQDSFVNYEHVGRGSFVRYANDGNSVSGNFRSYAAMAGSRFSNYEAHADSGSDNFNSYGNNSNVNRQDFTSYGSDSGSALEIFTSYTENSNVAENRFKTYSSDANAATATFNSYADQSNVLHNDFKMYSKGGNGALDQFGRYGTSSNVVRNDFGSYGKKGNGGLEQFENYGDGSSQSINGFQSYGKGSNDAEIFGNYGNTTFPSKNDFVEYGKDGGSVPLATFSEYVGNDTSFSQYFKIETSFSSYINFTGAHQSEFKVEPGKFFRQADLVQGKRIPMPDIRDKMPERSFLPKVLAEKLPFSSSRLPELVGMLNATELEPAMAKTIADCERPAVKDETKQCATSIESMVEFAVSVLGKTAIVSTTANTNGWGQSLVVGEVRPRNGGKVTRSVSCHQSLFPYLVYYCHQVPRVMVYDVDLVEVKSGKKVNEGVGICHLDTTQWSANHAAFMALGHGPGKIEVCHWIFENDLIWVACE